MARPKLSSLVADLNADDNAAPETSQPEPVPAQTLQSVPAATETPAETTQAIEAATPTTTRAEPLDAQAPQPEAKVTATPAKKPAKKPAARKTRPAPRKPPVKTTPVADLEDEPFYKSLIRKECRFTDDQLDELNRARRGEGYPFTDNSLIRVAVDYILTEADTLLADSPTTEDEMREALGLPTS